MTESTPNGMNGNPRERVTIPDLDTDSGAESSPIIARLKENLARAQADLDNAVRKLEARVGQPAFENARTLFGNGCLFKSEYSAGSVMYTIRKGSETIFDSSVDPRQNLDQAEKAAIALGMPYEGAGSIEMLSHLFDLTQENAPVSEGW